MIKKNLWIVLIVSLCGFQFGYNTSIISGAILFVSKTFSLSFINQGHAVSILIIGALVGTLLGGFLANRLGRKGGMQGACLFFMGGALVASLSNTLGWFLVGRVLQGIGVGSVAVIAPMYLVEIIPPNKRGVYLGISQIFLVGGGLIAYICTVLLAKTGDWRLMLGLGVVPAILQFVLLFFIPESKETSTKPKEMSWKLLLSPSFRGVLSEGVFLNIFQQLVGINAVCYFLPRILEKAGYGERALVTTLGIGVINVIVTIIAAKLIDSVGRRPLLLWGTVGIVITLCLAALSLNGEGPWTQMIALFSLTAYIACFTMSMGPLPSLITAEIYPAIIKDQAMSLATFFNWAANYVVTLTFLSLAQTITFPGAFLLYAIMGVLAFVFIWKRVPETKGMKEVT